MTFTASLGVLKPMKERRCGHRVWIYGWNAEIVHYSMTSTVTVWFQGSNTYASQITTQVRISGIHNDIQLLPLFDYVGLSLDCQDCHCSTVCSTVIFALLKKGYTSLCFELRVH